MLPLLLFCSLLASLFAGSTVATSWPTPLFTTNTSLVQRGHPFTAKCEVMHFEAPNETYIMRFWRGTTTYSADGIFRYAFPAGGSRIPTLNNWSDSTLTVRSLAYSLTMAQVEITPLITGDFYFKCDYPDSFSNNVLVKVVGSLPRLATNETHFKI